MSTAESLGSKAASGIGKFFIGILMFIILVAITIFVMGAAVFELINSSMDTPVALGLGIALSVIYAIVIFTIPYLRKIGTVKWFAICAIGDAVCWAYLLFTN